MNKLILIILFLFFSAGVSYAQLSGSPPSNIQADVQATKVVITWTPSTGSYMNRNVSDSDHILVYTNPDFTGTKILDGGVNGGNNKWELPINTSGAYGTVRPGVAYYAKVISFNAPCNCSSGVQTTFTVPNTTTIAPTAAQPVCSGIPSDRGLVTMPISITEGGSYTIWSRMMSQGASSDSFYIKVDDQCPILVGNSTSIQQNDGWIWVDFSGTGGKVIFQLSPGNHLIQLIGNEGGTRVDRILLSNNTCTPTGMGDNCVNTPAPPTATPTPVPVSPALQVSVSADNQTYASQITTTIQQGYYLKINNLTSAFTGDLEAKAENGSTFKWHRAENNLVRVTPESLVNNPPGSYKAQFRIWKEGINNNPWSNQIDVIIQPTQRPDISPTISPTATPTPVPAGLTITPTNPSLPNATTVLLTIKLHGLGTGGDNKNPNGGGNASPVRVQRELSLRIYTATNQEAGKAVLTLTFDPTTGTYKGTTSLVAPPGPYQIRVESTGFLKRTYPGIYTLGPNTQIILPIIALITGDSIPDNKLDLLDYNLLMNCFSDISPAKSCTPAQKISTDLTDDTKVNQNDYNLLIRELSAQAGD